MSPVCVCVCSLVMMRSVDWSHDCCSLLCCPGCAYKTSCFVCAVIQFFSCHSCHLIIIIMIFQMLVLMLCNVNSVFLIIIDFFLCFKLVTIKLHINSL